MINPLKFKLTCCLLLFYCICFAQDSIFFKSKLIIVGKVTQIGQGKVFLIPEQFAKDQVAVGYKANHIYKIKYESGREDIVFGNPIYQNTSSLFVNYQLNQSHLIDVSLYNIWHKELRLQYSYFFKNKNIAIYLPLKTSLIKPNYYLIDEVGRLEERAAIGLGAKTFVNKKSRSSFYVGLGFFAGFSKYYYSTITYATYNAVINRYFIHPHIMLGYQHFLSRSLYLSFNGLFGPSFYPYHRKLDASSFDLEVRLGYRIK